MKSTSRRLRDGTAGKSERRSSQEANRGANRSKKNSQAHSGIHNRRDKRYPFAPSRHPVSEAEATAPSVDKPETASWDTIPEWKEALMLWLSWNSTYEKVASRMCKEGVDQRKIEAMMDEMDQLRRRAIEMSERMIS